MESKDELKEINLKNCTCYYFDDIKTHRDFCSDHNLLDRKSYEHVKLFYYMTFHTKLQLVQNHCVSASMR